ncbi:unnamed protein product, partial [Didymodactylos carnosus]
MCSQPRHEYAAPFLFLVNELSPVSAHNSNTRDQNEVQICLDAIETDGFTTDCLHLFHGSCFGRWMRLNFTCPICRQNLFIWPDAHDP